MTTTRPNIIDNPVERTVIIKAREALCTVRDSHSARDPINVEINKIVADIERLLGY